MKGSSSVISRMVPDCYCSSSAGRPLELPVLIVLPEWGILRYKRVSPDLRHLENLISTLSLSELTLFLVFSLGIFRISHSLYVKRQTVCISLCPALSEVSLAPL